MECTQGWSAAAGRGNSMNFHWNCWDLFGIFPLFPGPKRRCRGKNWILIGFIWDLGWFWGENPFQEGKFRSGIPALGFGGFLFLIWAFLLLILGGFIPHFWGFHSWFWFFFTPDFGVFTPILIPFFLLLFPPGFGWKTPKFGSEKQEIIEKKRGEFGLPTSVFLIKLGLKPLLITPRWARV